jgi:microcystin-dependent protein
MATVTKGRTFVSGEVVTPTKINTLVDSATVTNIQTADIADQQITLAKLVTTIQQALLPAGAVQAFAMNAAPPGWLAADGSTVSRTTYSALWAALGTTSSPYGQGDGSTTFNLPDLRASFVRGAGSDGVATAGSFGVKQGDAYASHNHTITDPGHGHAITDPGHNHDYSIGSFAGGGKAGGSVYTPLQSYAGAVTGGRGTGITINGNTTGITIAASGSTETRPRNIAMLYCIKF